MQEYVEARSRARGKRGQNLSPTTIKKEVTSFSGVWTWGVQLGVLSGSFPSRGLKYPETSEKPPFQTWTEIERQIERGGLTPEQQAELWDCLFLTLSEIMELLSCMKDRARFPFVYPMFVFAAHTGARRSEICRSRLTDLDFASGTILIHEKKRVKGKRTTRRVPLTPLLAQVMNDWLPVHPGGGYPFSAELHLARARKTREEYGPLTSNEANHHFQRTLIGSKWERLRGWHVFRHSFCSNCAARGVDQRLINAWVGHQTEEMVKRYRHLIPNQQQQAIQLVFGQG